MKITDDEKYMELYLFDGNSCGILSYLHEQSTDINRGVDKKNIEDQGAGDQGIMFGYATNETENYMPLTLDLSNKILIRSFSRALQLHPENQVLQTFQTKP